MGGKETLVFSRPIASKSFLKSKKYGFHTHITCIVLLSAEIHMFIIQVVQVCSPRSSYTHIMWQA